MTTAKRLINQGKQEGRQEGRQEGLHEATKGMILRFFLEKKMELKNIADLLDLEIGFVRQVLQEEGLLAELVQRQIG